MLRSTNCNSTANYFVLFRQMPSYINQESLANHEIYIMATDLFYLFLVFKK